MTQQITLASNDRYVNNGLSELEDANRNPIDGYENLPMMTLEQSVQSIFPLVPCVMDLVAAAKQKCHRNSNLLTWDESAAIYLYTMPTYFFSHLNENLRARDRHGLKPWFAFLKLFISALGKLPSLKTVVWRGIKNDLGFSFIANTKLTWWSVTSCSQDAKVVEPFIGEIGFLLNIGVINGKDISMYSMFPEEQEVILMPGTHLHVNGNPFNFQNILLIISLKEESITIQNTQGQNMPEPIPEHRTIVIPEKKGWFSDPQFYSNFPQELVGIIQPADFQQSITNINHSRQTTHGQKVPKYILMACSLIGLIMTFVGLALVSLPNTRIWIILFSIGMTICTVSPMICRCTSAWLTMSNNTRMMEAINAESIKYSAKLSIPITWRLNMTMDTIGSGEGQQTIVNHFIIIDIGKKSNLQINMDSLRSNTNISALQSWMSQQYLQFNSSHPSLSLPNPSNMVV